MATIPSKRREPIPPPVGGVVEPTDTHKYRSKNGLWYDEYQKMVNANIADNTNHLLELGLLDDALKPSRTKLMLTEIESNAKAHARSQLVKSRRMRSAASAGPVRRSSRKRNVGPENNGLTDDDLNDSLQQRVKKKKETISPTSRIVSRGRNEFVNYVPLTEVQRAKLAEIPQDEWVEDMREYLLREERLSVSNCASVMRQVVKLASGVGITYARWPERVAFRRGRRINMGANFDGMLNDAVDFENEHGADLGNGTYRYGTQKSRFRIDLRTTNMQPRQESCTDGLTSLFRLFNTSHSGWLLRHPIKKLNNFQQHLLEQLVREG